MVYTGKAQSPKKVADDVTVINKVLGGTKAIGHEDNESVRVILTIP